MGEFTLGFLEHVDVLKDPLSFCVVTEHVCGEAYKLAQVEAAAVGIKMVHQLFGSYIGVEGRGVVEIPISEFVHGITDELGSWLFCGLRAGKVTDQDGMSGFMVGTYNGGGIIGNGKICRWTSWDGEGGTPGGCVRDRWFDDADEIVLAIIVILY